MGTRQSPGFVRTEANSVAPVRRGFTLTELMVAVGLICVLISLFLPVMAKVRVAASATRCSSNLHQMGIAFSLYLSESNGRAPEYVFNTAQNPDVGWNAYWPGILEQHKIKGDVLICPLASGPTGIERNHGYGDALHCWTGQFTSIGTVIRLNDSLWRDSSYGYNRYLTAGGFAGPAVSLAALRAEFSNTPAFMDCVWVDAQPLNGSAESPAAPPPDLSGAHVVAGSPEHWKFLISRHGRGINVCMADGSVVWVPLEDTYMLSWKKDWSKYRLELPPN